MNIRLWPDTTAQLKTRAEKQVALFTALAKQSNIPVCQKKYEAEVAWWLLIVAACDEALRHDLERVA